MPPKQLEKIMLQFLKVNIVVIDCTILSSSGIYIPYTHTFFYTQADRFGLSYLHQLRGRVWRFDKQSYSYFIVPGKKTLSAQAKSRIEAIEKYDGLGAGFQIAYEDLQIRGAGNLLGEEQSGYIAAIGFDLYCRLLKESVENLKKGS